MPHQHRHGHGCPKRCLSPGDGAASTRLSECCEGQKAIIRSNPDLRTLEMGLCSGVPVRIMRNEKSERKMLLCLHGQRYVIPIEIAEQILVKPCPASQGKMG